MTLAEGCVYYMVIVYIILMHSRRVVLEGRVQRLLITGYMGLVNGVNSWVSDINKQNDL